MRKRSTVGRMRSALAALALSGLMLLPAADARADDTAERVFAGYQDNILQVRIIDRGSGSKAAIGSGFTVSADGLIVTNYHVVSELVRRPETYRAELVDDADAAVGLTLLAVDVVHDLAVLRPETPRSGFLRLAGAAPAKGEQLFAFGNPHDLGLTIVTGTYNGLLEKSLYEKVHFTGSINPGMSGGPTLNRFGEVVGVNVSTAGNQISFLVPVSYVRALLARIPEAAPDADALAESVRAQLLDNQAAYMSDLLETPFATVPMGDYRLPGELAPFIRCWGDTLDKPEELFRQVYQSCSSEDDIFLSDDQQTGIVRFAHELFTSEGLGPARFYRFLERHFNNPHTSLGGLEESLTNFDCRSGFVTGDSLETKVVYCLRGYKKYEGIYDVFLTATTLTKSDEALHTTLSLAGVSADNAQKFTRTYLEAITWTP